MSNSTCEPFLDNLPLFVTGDLDSEASADLQAHLDQCAQCRRVLAQEQRIVQLLQTAADTVDDAGVPDGFFDDRLATAVQPRWSAGRWILAAAALLLTFLLGMAVESSRSSDGSTELDARAQGRERLGQLFVAQSDRRNGLAQALAVVRGASQAPR